MRFLKKFKMMNFISKWLSFVTVEPSFFFYYSAYVILELINTNLYLQKPCRLNATSEPDLDTKCDDEKAGITFVADLNAYVRTFVVLFMLLYVVIGSYWSDESGRRRRPLLFLPLIGQVLQCINGLVQSYYWQLPAISAASIDLLVQCIFGGHLVMLIISHVYVCDMSSKQDRTMRIGILTALKTICLPIGNGTSGYLLHAVGFFYSYMICLVMTIVAFMLGVIFIKDTSVQCENKITVWQACSCKAFKDSLKVLFKKSLGEKKKIVYVLLCVHVLVWFSSEGEKSVLYLYLRYKFNWDERMYSLYSTYRLIGIIVGTIFCSIFLSKYLKIHDGLIGAFAGFWDTLAVIGFLFATKNWHLYVIPIVDIFHGVAIAVYYSYLSKFYESNEFGRLSSSLNIFSLIIPLYNPVYNILFQKTLDFFPSAFFLVSVVVDITICILYSTTYVLGKKYGM
ncbi:lysosomal proton-coupled steroid conjugate and bile acid symporter SLC46A3-like isoform X2 [Planococcus citri]|uniref:lysosomal proton-coupled steroid conjugate and bile acid symporter SLC46A3-like isoform X2 n=1 Tax=Planococcus citri TaxID=170843 RepID=UPI0031F72695